MRGPNLTFLGRCEPRLSTTTATELETILQRHARQHGYVLDIFYSNIEGEAINHIYRAGHEGFDGLVMNRAGFTYAGFALKVHRGGQAYESLSAGAKLATRIMLTRLPVDTEHAVRAGQE